jgi:hypothetical protein
MSSLELALEIPAMRPSEALIQPFIDADIRRVFSFRQRKLAKIFA